MKKSALVSLASLMAAFLKAEGVEGIGQNPQYLTANQTQIDFFRYYDIHKNDIASIPEIKSLATDNYQKLKSYLEKNKFDATSLRPFGRDTIGIASLLEIVSPWECTPGITQMSASGPEYKAICFNSDCLDIRKNNTKHEPIFRIPLKNGDWVIISVEYFPKSVGGITEQLVDLLKNSNTNPRPQYKGIVLPYVSINSSCDMTWLLNLKIVGKYPNPYILSQAIHQNMLTLNHEGIMARSASTISLTRNYVYETAGFYTVDRPFLFAVVRPKVSTPLFTGYFMPDSWVRK